MFLTDDKEYQFPSIYFLKSETHGADDVAVFARGPCAHLLSGNYEQSYIAHAMGYAARVGPSVSSAASLHISFLAAVTLLCYCAFKLLTI